MEQVNRHLPNAQILGIRWMSPRHPGLLWAIRVRFVHDGKRRQLFGRGPTPLEALIALDEAVRQFASEQEHGSDDNGGESAD